MNNEKTKLRNKMEDEYLCNYLMLHIEKEIAETIPIDSFIKELASMRECNSLIGCEICNNNTTKLQHFMYIFSVWGKYE